MTSFWTGHTFDDFLFEGLDITNVAGLTGICLGLVSLTVLFEGFRLLLQRSAIWCFKNPNPLSSTSCQYRRENDPEEGETTENSRLNTSPSTVPVIQKQLFPNCLKLSANSLLHTGFVILGFLLMNAVMSFNVSVFISVIFGHGLGYFLFGNVQYQVVNEVPMTTVNVRRDSLLSSPLNVTDQIRTVDEEHARELGMQA